MGVETLAAKGTEEDIGIGEKEVGGGVDKTLLTGVKEPLPIEESIEIGEVLKGIGDGVIPRRMVRGEGEKE